MRRGREQRHHRHLTRISFAWLLAACLLLGCSGPRSSGSRSEDELYREGAATLLRGSLKEAEESFERGNAIWSGRPDSVWHWNYRMLGAETLIAQGRAGDALRLVGDPLPDTPGLSNLQARWKTVHAYALLSLGRLEEVPALLNAAEELASQTGEADLIPKIQILRGQRFLALRRAEEADDQFRAALRLAEQQNDLYRQASALNALGVSRIRNNRFDEAVPFLEGALAAAETSGAKLVESGARTNLGLCANMLGDFDAARVHYEAAIAIQQEQGAKPFLQASLGEVGNIYTRENNPAKAIPYYRQALDLAHEVNSLADVSRWSGNLAVALILTGDWDQAEKFNNESIALKEKLNDSVSQSYSRLNAADIAAGRGEYAKAEELYQEALRSAPGNAPIQWEAHAGLGKVFRKTGDERMASEHFEAAIRTIKDFRGELSTGTLSASTRTPSKVTLPARLIGFYQEYVDTLVDRQDYDRALQVAESSRALLLSERLGLQRTANREASSSDYEKAAARSGTVLLSYWLAPTRSFLWVITPRTKRFFVLPGRDEIESQVAAHNAFIENLRDPLDAGRIAADYLYENLVAAAAPFIPAGSPVVIVPDGALHGLNFETLPVPGGRPHYWIEDVAISIAPSLDTQIETIALRPPRSLLLIGNPLTAVKEYPELPFAGRELRSIEQRLPSLEREVFERADAQPQAFAAASPEKYSIIHFAAHATANPVNPLASAIILSQGKDTFRLYASDLANTPLNADLVTISGCRSAGARVYSGEGLMGFTWTFLQAGAKSVIAGLWDVSDASTAQLMDGLYSGIAAGLLPADALRNAKLALIRSDTNFRKPYYWGPFQVYVRGAFTRLP